MRLVVAIMLSVMAPVATFAGSPGSPVVSVSSSGLTPVHYPPPQVTGCRLVGRTFGALGAGGAIIFRGGRYEVTGSHGEPLKIVYSGPQVSAIFTPRRPGSILEGDDGVPNRVGPDARGTLRITIGGFVVVTDAREHCVWFE